MMIESSPPQRHLVARISRLMTHSDIELLAFCLEWFRTQGKLKSERKVTGKVVYDALVAFEKQNPVDVLKKE